MTESLKDEKWLHAPNDASFKFTVESLYVQFCPTNFDCKYPSPPPDRIHELPQKWKRKNNKVCNDHKLGALRMVNGFACTIKLRVDWTVFAHIMFIRTVAQHKPKCNGFALLRIRRFNFDGSFPSVMPKTCEWHAHVDPTILSKHQNAAPPTTNRNKRQPTHQPINQPNKQTHKQTNKQTNNQTKAKQNKTKQKTTRTARKTTNKERTKSRSS